VSDRVRLIKHPIRRDIPRDLPRDTFPYIYREKESPRLMHVVALHFTLYLFWGAALVSERGVLVRKENRSGVRKGSCD
jgi:hypothetical protein